MASMSLPEEVRHNLICTMLGSSDMAAKQHRTLHGAVRLAFVTADVDGLR